MGGDLNLWLAAIAVVAVAIAGFALLTLRRERLRLPSAPASAETDSGGPMDGILDHIPDPIILTDDQARVMEANKAARVLLPALRERHPLSFALRSPDVLEALDKVTRTGGALKADFSQRIPTERRFEVQVTALNADPQDPSARPRSCCFFVISRRLGASSACEPTSSPTPAMNFGLLWHQSWGSSTRCKGPPATIRRHASASSTLCETKQNAWRG